MGCEECEKAKKERKAIINYKWKDTSIGILGCEKHVLQVMLYLKKSQVKSEMRNDLEAVNDYINMLLDEIKDLKWSNKLSVTCTKAYREYVKKRKKQEGITKWYLKR